MKGPRLFKFGSTIMTNRDFNKKLNDYNRGYTFSQVVELLFLMATTTVVITFVVVMFS